MRLIDPTGMEYTEKDKKRDEELDATFYGLGGFDLGNQQDDGKDRKKKDSKKLEETQNAAVVPSELTVWDYLLAAGTFTISKTMFAVGSLFTLQGDTDPNQAAQMRAEQTKSNIENKNGEAENENASLKGSEHFNGKRKSTENKHQKGQSRKLKDQGKEKADGRRINWK